jgi:RNA polymerase sigma factor (sigma-70 family)
MEFPTTIWSRIRSGDYVARKYRSAIFEFLRAKGVREPDAEELTQNVLIAITNAEFLERADRSKGRFRNLLLRVTVRVWQQWLRERGAQKRGGDRATALSIDLGALPDDDAPMADEQFDRAWARALLTRALERVRNEDPDCHAILVGLRIEGKSYDEVAREHGSAMRVVKLRAERGKKALGRAVVLEIQEYCCSPEEIEVEVRSLKELFD